MYVPFLLFVVVIVLVLIFWELGKIHSRLKQMLAHTHDTMKSIKTRNCETGSRLRLHGVLVAARHERIVIALDGVSFLLCWR